MCGIFGYVGSDPALASVDTLEVALRALRHRGPDDAGSFRDVDSRAAPSCAFAHTRLAILDLSPAGHQPLTTPDGRYTIVYNGELYNHLELRRDLEREGLAFRSTCDTEVLLAAYARWGSKVVSRLRGMFAFGVWDARSRSLFLARDRFGIKPLYYAETSAGLCFASEVRALLAVSAVPRRISSRGLATMLAFGAVAAPETILEGVLSLAPGHTLSYRGGESTIERYWHPSLSRDALGVGAGHDPGTFDEAAEELRPLLAEAVKMHLISDVPVGVFLSGGVDSSVLTALASAASERPLHTFTVAFNQTLAEAQFSEAEHAATIARRHGCKHTQVVLEGNALAAQIADAVRALDQPSADGLNTYVVSKAARQAGLAVALAGVGGDELFAGYPAFRAIARAESLGSAVPNALSGALRDIAGAVARGPFGSPRVRRMAGVVAARGRPEALYPLVRAYFTPSEVAELAPDLEAPPSSYEGLAEIQAARAALEAGDAVNALSVLELSNYMHNTLLRDSDVMSMAHSLEVRVPLLDHVFAERALAAPGRLKLEGRGNKALLMALAPGLPRDVSTRKKMGFVLPLEVWLRGPLRSWVEGLLFDVAPARLAPVLRRAAIERHWRTFLDRGDTRSCSRVWCIAALAGWAEANRASVG